MLISAVSYQIHRASSWLQPQKDLELKKNPGISIFAAMIEYPRALLTQSSLPYWELTSELWKGDGAWWTSWDLGWGRGVPPQAHGEHRPARGVSHAEWLQVVYPTWHLAGCAFCPPNWKGKTDWWMGCWKLGDMWASQNSAGHVVQRECQFLGWGHVSWYTERTLHSWLCGKPRVGVWWFRILKFQLSFC